MPRKPKLIKIDDSFENVAQSLMLGVDKKKKGKKKNTKKSINKNNLQ